MEEQLPRQIPAGDIHLAFYALRVASDPSGRWKPGSFVSGDEPYMARPWMPGSADGQISLFNTLREAMEYVSRSGRNRRLPPALVVDVVQVFVHGPKYATLTTTVEPSYFQEQLLEAVTQYSALLERGISNETAAVATTEVVRELTRIRGLLGG
jgi:hypothetical protein